MLKLNQEATVSRADENKSERRTRLEVLKSWLERQKPGETIPINTWYKIAADLGLGRSDRQRISEARDLGYDFRYDKAAKAYVWRGIQKSGQLELLEATNA